MIMTTTTMMMMIIIIIFFFLPLGVKIPGVKNKDKKIN